MKASRLTEPALCAPLPLRFGELDCPQPPLERPSHSHEVRRLAGAEGERLLHCATGDRSIGGSGDAGRQGRSRGARWFLEEAPDTYYVTDSYEKHPIVPVRLSRIDRDVLAVSRRLTAARTRKRGTSGLQGSRRPPF